MPRLIGCSLQQKDFHLQGRIGKAAENLCLGDDFGGHQVEQGDFQGANILMAGPLVRHDENALIGQGCGRRQIRTDIDRHRLQDVYKRQTAS